MKSKIVTLSLVAVLGTSGLLFPNNNHAFAETLEEKKQKIEKQQSDVSSNLNEKENEITKLEQEEAKLAEEIKKIDFQVAETNGKIREKAAEIEETKKEIETLKAQIEDVKARIAERNKLLEERARALQESGGTVSYLDVLLGAQSFGNLVARVSAVTTIVEADRELLKAHEEDKKLLEQAEADLNSKLKQLEKSLRELETLKGQLSAQVKQKQELMKNVQHQHDEATHEVHELKDEAAFLAEQKRAIELEQKRQKEAAEAAARAAAEAAKRQAEAQKQAQAQAKAQAASSSNSSSSSTKASTTSSSSSSSASTQTPAVSSASFMWPASGTFTSGYGTRIHPITGARKLHAGIDIANSADVPVVASASGTVIRSEYSSSYGNVVYITHNIGGQIYTTLYAHLETRHVSAGQAVSKGQQIGIMGNTGQSTGQHLHFEIHKGPWSGASSSVNPMSYLK